MIDYELRGVTDQHGDRWVCVTRCNATAWVPLTELMERSAFGRLARSAVLILPGRPQQDFIRTVGTIDVWPEEYLIDHVGWHDGQFALGDGTVVAAGDGRHEVVFEPDKRKWSTKGTLDEWRDGVARPLADQFIPMFGLMTAFAAPLKELVGAWSNVGFEFVGAGGLGKSSLLSWVSSVYGGDGSDPAARYWESWNTTLAGLETLAPKHADCLLILDEFNLFGQQETSRKRQAMVRSAAFQLGHASGRTRFGSTRPQAYRLLYLSSSNTPLTSALNGDDSTSTKAAADRLLTLSADARAGYGIFHSLPAGFETSSDLVRAVNGAAAANYGVAIREYLGKLVASVAVDREGVTAKLGKWIREFRDAAAIDQNQGSAVRTADSFALIYAAGKLARAYDILPKDWRCKTAVLACYHQHVQEKRLATGAPIDQVGAFAARAGVADLRRFIQLPDLTDGEVRAAAGFLLRGQGRNEFVIHPTAFQDAGGTKALMRVLRAEDIAICDGPTFTTKRKVRSNKAWDRLYVFRLDVDAIPQSPAPTVAVADPSPTVSTPTIRRKFAVKIVRGPKRRRPRQNGVGDKSAKK